MWGFWWIFPLLGMALFVMLIVLLARVFGGGVSSGSRKEIEELRKKVRELKEEIEKVKKQGN
jgi:hypothetical protein